MNAKLASYLRHLAALSAAMACASKASAEEPDAVRPTSATSAQSSIERILLQAETQENASQEFSMRLPWYYQAWPESTWRQFSVASWLRKIIRKIPFAVEPAKVQPTESVESFAALLKDIRNQD